MDWHGNPVINQRTESYSYDELNRLSAVNYGDGETQSYGFDAMGNRLVKMDATASGTVTTNSAYDLANRLTSVNASSYANDANGNTLTGGGRTMTWDSQNRMVSCSYSGNTLTFDYGSDGLRRSETLTSGGQSVTTYYVYDAQSLVMEETKNAQGVLTPSASYLNGPRGPEYKKDETTNLVKWYLYDGLGSVIGEVDPAGNVDCSAKYDVYGSVRGTTGTATSAQGFVGGCGHLSEAATGLIYMKARYYDPSTGRFVSQDPAMHGMNWFIYCEDNPVNSVDADGKSATSVTIQIAVFLTCCAWSDLFRSTLAVCFSVMLLAILAPLAFVVSGGWIPVIGLPYGIVGAYYTAQAILNMCSTALAYANSAITDVKEGSIGNAVKECLLMVEGYNDGIELMMEADELMSGS